MAGYSRDNLICAMEIEGGPKNTLRNLQWREERDDAEEQKYDNPDGCVAIVAVGHDGSYLFIERPNLWMFESEPRPQDNGFGQSFDQPPGVYRMTFSCREHRDPESGYVDDWEFQVRDRVLLWEPPKNRPPLPE